MLAPDAFTPSMPTGTASKSPNNVREPNDRASPVPAEAGSRQGSNLPRLSRRFYRGHPPYARNDRLRAVSCFSARRRLSLSHSSTTNSRNPPDRVGLCWTTSAGQQPCSLPRNPLPRHSAELDLLLIMPCLRLPQPWQFEGKPTRTAGSASDRGPEAARQRDVWGTVLKVSCANQPGRRTAALVLVPDIRARRRDPGRVR